MLPAVAMIARAARTARRWPAVAIAVEHGLVATPARTAATAAAARKPANPPPSPPVAKGGAGGGKAAAAERVYDFKPVLPRHQVVWAPALTAGGATAPGAPTWQPTSRRPGMLMLKCGMTGDYDKWGVRKAMTVLKVEDAVVTGVVRADARGYDAVAVGAGTLRPQSVTKPIAGAYAKSGIPPPEAVAEFRVSPDVAAAVAVGTRLDIRHWIPGQRVTITGTSQGKGFQGAMKLHGFGGQRASHGNSLSHRVLGSTGCRQDPGKVMKGKKMAAHMGVDTITVSNLTVAKIDIRTGLLYLWGCVPGKAGSWLRVRDAAEDAFPPGVTPPFPTYTPTPADVAAAAAWSSGAYFDPATEAALAASGGLPAGYVRAPAFEWVVPPPAVDPFAIPENDEMEEV